MANDAHSGTTEAAHEIAKLANEHAIGEAAHVAESAGMPQLDFATFPNQIFWLAVTLVVIYLVLTKVALPRIATVLSDRQGTITGDIAAAEELKAKAHEAEEAYLKALADARAEAARIAVETKAEVQGELDLAIAKADAEIAAQTAESAKAIAVIRDGAKDSVIAVAKDAAKDIVSAFGTKADAATLKAAVTARMKG